MPVLVWEMAGGFLYPHGHHQRALVDCVCSTLLLVRNTDGVLCSWFQIYIEDHNN